MMRRWLDTFRRWMRPVEDAVSADWLRAHARSSTTVGIEGPCWTWPVQKLEAENE